MANNITADHIAREQTISASRALVLSTIPLTKNRFNKQSDFVRFQSAILPTWEEYEEHVALPVIAVLKNMHVQGAVPDYDVRYTDFQKAWKYGPFDVVFLVIHHIEEAGELEFNGKPVSITEMMRFIQETSLSSAKHLVLFSCKSSAFMALKKEELPGLGALTTAFWNMSVLGSYFFANNWIRYLDGHTTLSEAYAKAVNDSINIFKNK